MLSYQLVLIFILCCLYSVSSEHRKLIPKCLNSCLNGPRSDNCFCDSKCSLIYNDCCQDAPFRSFRVNTQRIHNINCIFVHGENKDFWMVDACKDSWSGHEHIRKKCESARHQVGETNDATEAVPVTSPKEEVTYKNYYCGLCNDENPEDLVEWQIKALCPSLEIRPLEVLQNLTYVEDKQQWGVWKTDNEEHWKFHECHLLFQRPQGVTSGIRQCISNMVQTCPSSWRNIAIRRRCKSYVDPIKWSDGPVYKNIDCAMCHNMTAEGFQCVYDKIKGVDKNSHFTECLIISDVPGYLKRKCSLLPGKHYLRLCIELDSTASEGILRWIHDSRGHGYRNPHCGLCNNNRISQLWCRASGSLRRV